MDKKGENYEKVKTILVGDSGAGKSSMMHRFTTGEYNESLLSTIGVDFKNKNVKVDGQNYTIMIWDTAGQERFRTITSTFYRNTQGVVMVFDITSAESFNNIKKWNNEVDQHIEDNIARILVGNKCDLEADRKVPRETAEKLAQNWNIQYFEVSARTGDGIDSVFNYMAKLCVEKKKASQADKCNKESYQIPQSTAQTKKKHSLC